MPKMVRKQVYLTGEQDQMLRRAASRGRCADAAIIRAALDRYFEKPSPAMPITKDPLWDIVGLGESSAGDLSDRVDHYLYQTRTR
jgi:hypothetical protein